VYQVVSAQTTPERRVVIRAHAGPKKKVAPPPPEPVPPAKWPARYRAFIGNKEYEQHNYRFTPHSFLRLPLEFEEPEALHRRVLKEYSQLQDQGDWYPKHPRFRALAVYAITTDEEAEIHSEANPSEVEEFFLVDTSNEECPVYLWTHDLRFPNLEKVAKSLDAFLAELTKKPRKE